MFNNHHHRIGAGCGGRGGRIPTTMRINITPKEDTSIQNEGFYKGTKYTAIVVDYWDAETPDKAILGLMVTGGHHSRTIVACNQGDLFNQFYVD